jgi:integrase
MQTGSVSRHGAGWRARWREDGRLRSTPVVRTKGQARELLNAELRRLELGAAYRPPITLAELAERFLDQYTAAPQTIRHARRRLQRPLDQFGAAQASDVTTETLQKFIATVPVGKAFRHDITRTLRQVYRFGVEAHLVDHNPATRVHAPAPARGERILPFESWQEVERVAAECGRWGPLVIFMADTGARPAEAVMLEHRHVDGNVVELPGVKTVGAWRTVHMTRRGVEAIQSVPRALNTRRVFHIDGRPISWPYFYREVWHTALELAGLEYRAPYCLRHSFCYWSMRSGVPIATIAREMGHASTEQTSRIYGGWSRDMGADAAMMREAWAENAAARTHDVTSGD